MPRVRSSRSLIRIPPAARSAEVASFFAQLDDQSRRIFEDLRDCTPGELAWQPRRGMNTIGMLLAHCAIVEVFWLQIAAGRYSREALNAALGIDEDDDGMPLAAGGPPSPHLRGWTFARYRALLDRARRHAKRTASRFATRDLEGLVTRTRRDGSRSTLNRRWILYHVLEHLAGHYGQMLLLRHLYRDRRRS